MYDLTLIVHSFFRWVVILTGVGLLISLGVFAFRQATSTIPTWSILLSKIYSHSFSLQLIVGVFLFLIPGSVAQSVARSPQLLTSVPLYRYFLLEHTLLMTVALSLAHLGSAKLRKGREIPSQLKQSFWILLASFFITLVSIPWPFFRFARPLFRLSLE